MKKLQLVFAVFSLSLFFVVIRLFYIQVIAAEKHGTNLYLQTQRIIPARGEIYDRTGEPLVLNQTRFQLFAEPKKMEKESLSDDLSKLDEILKLGESTLEAKFDMNKQWVAIQSDLDEEIKKKIEDLKLVGIGFDEMGRRFYPESSLSAHLLGFVGKTDSGDDIGYFGIEGFYDRDLAGLPGIVKSERDVLGKPILLGTQDKLKGENGRTLTLTIDKNVTRIAKQKLMAGIERYGAKSGCITIANPMTGEILTISCLPDFDPDKYGEFSEEYFRNPVISDSFEPGSIFKPIVMGAALNEKAVKIDDKYNEAGPIQLGKYYIRTWDDKYLGQISMSEILQKSSNVGMVYVGSKLGDKKLLSYFKKFGLGEKTGIDLQGEVGGVLRPDKDWREIDYATATFGQGIAMTRIQILTAFSALINGGTLMQPHTVKKMTTADGKSEEIPPLPVRQVISAKTSRLIKQMLMETVKHGEAKWKVPKGYKIGGKTGTAQIPIEGHYDPSKTIASYIGFAPVDNPKFIALVTLTEPTSSPWGSETAAPLFFEVARELLVYYNIAPQ